MSVPFFLFGLAVAALGAYLCYSIPKQKKSLTEPIDGIVVSYEEGWLSQGSSSKGREKKSVRAWFPVVTYSVNGVTHNYTCRDVPELSQPVGVANKTIPLLYNPANPAKCIEAESNKTSSVWIGPIIILVGIVLIVLSFVG